VRTRLEAAAHGALVKQKKSRPGRSAVRAQWLLSATT
jgi:hypothetical protein